MRAVLGDERHQPYHRKIGKAERWRPPATQVTVVAVDPAIRGMLINPWEADETGCKHCRYRSHYGA
jgi:hypothetical protein